MSDGREGATAAAISGRWLGRSGGGNLKNLEEINGEAAVENRCQWGPRTVFAVGRVIKFAKYDWMEDFDEESTKKKKTSKANIF